MSSLCIIEKDCEIYCPCSESFKEMQLQHLAQVQCCSQINRRFKNLTVIYKTHVLELENVIEILNIRKRHSVSSFRICISRLSNDSEVLLKEGDVLSDCTICQQMSEINTPTLMPSLVEKAIDQIIDNSLRPDPVSQKVLQHISNDIATASLNSIADQLSLTPDYITRLFKQSTGFSFRKFLNRLRIDVATSLISEGKLDCNSIANVLGYNEVNSFYRFFKKHTGLTPREYQRWLQGPENLVGNG